MTRLNLYVDTRVLKAIKMIAKKQKVPYSILIRTVLTSYLESYITHEKKKK